MLFDNTKIGFVLKSNFELEKAYFLFKIISNKTLTNFGKILLNIILTFKLPLLFIVKRTVFQQFCAGSNLEESMETVNKLFSKNVYSYLSYSVEGAQNNDSFKKSCQDVIDSIEFASDKKNIPFTVFKPTAISKTDNLMIGEIDKITLDRFDRICKKASEKNLKILIDAEESWIQDSIDSIVLMMMKKYNKQKTIVFNTVQMYRHDRLEYLKDLHNSSKQNDFEIGIKLVRGAYLEKENIRAKKLNYKTPICESKKVSDDNFNSGVKFIISNLDKFNLFCGTHNEESLYKIINMIDQMGIERSSDKIWFGQLFGMSDHITFNLANENYNVVKYLPYGPIKEVMSYLIRRAEENTSVKGQTSRELTLIKNEISRRRKN
ncbi:MAG TPA: proline dehydrogenase family protein [Flavobacteriaceae bacterium]|jgi:proline dehydrogenase|nr:proline dehydrogenase family protein [Flavobacteriaceae bacterium]HJO70319.1 proline dehydrogenase family protein [Flavobacteriaceae bacterium]|tara:strand:+ start:20274 stop:21404 length:1131 start_codon:yes stop_codon:yes gene_type:complete